MLQNTILDGTDIEVAQKVATELNAKATGYKIFLKDSSILFCWSSITPNSEAFEETVPIIINYLNALREAYCKLY